MSKMGVLSVILCALLGVALGQYQFSSPDPDQNDLSESWSVGDKMKIAWQKDWMGVGDPLDTADLWITWFRSDSFSMLLLGMPYNPQDPSLSPFSLQERKSQRRAICAKDLTNVDVE